MILNLDEIQPAVQEIKYEGKDYKVVPMTVEINKSAMELEKTIFETGDMNMSASYIALLTTIPKKVALTMPIQIMSKITEFVLSGIKSTEKKKKEPPKSSQS